ncbi:hypothetical protein EDC96DRAFT_448684 [Choanephora cucurbitarum]|nr:hypothetical protein EDC96DRAFT_448684 [Choanephora cucurbitarum]
MSLLLTKTCEYAILITIQQVETELDLKLPPSIDDLIPQKTTISTHKAKVDSHGNCAFNISLVYYVSFKQLIRLRKLNATTTLTVHQTNKSGQLPPASAALTMAEAKEVVPQAGHKLDQIYKFVSDKGSWCSLSHTQQQLKAGLFYVAMPDTNPTVAVASTPSIQLRSPPPTPTNLSNTLKKKKKAVSSILGNQTTNSPSSSLSVNTSTLHRKKKVAPKETKEQPRLRRVKSSLNDMNIEELADALKNVHLFHDVPPLPPPKSPISFSQVPPPALKQQSYHQIGKGSSHYTFYFRIMYADHVNSVLKDSTKRLKKPYISYSFLTHYTLAPAASISSQPTHIKSCYSLRGHLIEIQDWLDAQQYISLDYVLMDKWSKQTMGKARVPLEGIAFEGQQQDRVYPVYNEENEQLATVTVRIGIVSGWHQEDYFRREEEEARQRRTYSVATPSTRSSLTEESLLSPTMVDSWDNTIHQTKKMRHLSQSSVPTLLTSSTSTKSSTRAQPPPIHLVQSRPTSMASYLKKPTRHLTSSMSTVSYRQRKQCM